MKAKNTGLQVDAIHMLGISSTEASADLLKDIYKESNSIEVRKAVIEAYIIGDEAGAQYLISLYPRGSHADKQTVIQSMMIMDNTQGLIELLKTETDPELKREILQMLTIMGSEESDEYLFQLLENKG